MLGTQNIHLISIAEEYSYESSKHLLKDYKNIYLGELEYKEAARIFEHLQPNLRNEKFKYKDSNYEKYTMRDFIFKNINNILSPVMVKDILLTIKKKSMRAIQTIALVIYLYACDSVLSTDIMIHFFHLKEYSEAQEIIEEVNGIFNKYSIDLNKDEENHDFYVLCSKFFALFARDIFLNDVELRQIYAEVVKLFIYNVSILKIYKFNIFRRKGYDTSLFYSLFKSEGDEIYEYLYNIQNSPYLYQQRALFLGKLGKYNEAYHYMDMAYNALPNNFSIKNSRAVITFEANRGKTSDFAISKMKKSMETLEICY